MDLWEQEYHDLDRYQNGEAMCAYICNPDEFVGKYHWYGMTSRLANLDVN
ncbi:MAG: hypothetical protein K2J06_06975 [Muribaculaceae bacterium]|nr:hypothetical protein [Muribaculaceae bacterium]